MKRSIKTILLLLPALFTLTVGTAQTTKNKKVMKVQQLTKAEFLSKVDDFEAGKSEWKFKGERPAIVDFYATWCGPCKALAPVLEELAEEYAGRVDFYKVDSDREQELSAVFGIRSIPSLLFCPMEGEPQMMRGAAPKDELRKAIEQILLHNTAK